MNADTQKRLARLKKSRGGERAQQDAHVNGVAGVLDARTDVTLKPVEDRGQPMTGLSPLSARVVGLIASDAPKPARKPRAKPEPEPVPDVVPVADETNAGARPVKRRNVGGALAGGAVIAAGAAFLLRAAGKV